LVVPGIPYSCHEDSPFPRQANSNPNNKKKKKKKAKACREIKKRKMKDERKEKR